MYAIRSYYAENQLAGEDEIGEHASDGTGSHRQRRVLRRQDGSVDHPQVHPVIDQPADLV